MRMRRNDYGINKEQTLKCKQHTKDRAFGKHITATPVACVARIPNEGHAEKILSTSVTLNKAYLLLPSLVNDLVMLMTFEFSTSLWSPSSWETSATMPWTWTDMNLVISTSVRF